MSLLIDNNQLSTPENCRRLAAFYKNTLLGNVIPFWLKHGLDPVHGGIFTGLNADGSLIDTDKSVWFQGRAGWMFATLYNSVEKRPEWLDAAGSCVTFLRNHCYAPDGKLYFTVTQEGYPLRMRRYVYSESFAAIAYAAYAKATGEAQAAADAVKAFATYLHHSFTPGVMPPKFESIRPSKGICPLMIGIAVAQELQANLGNVEVSGKSCSDWISRFIREIQDDFIKPEFKALMETVAPDGRIINHYDGRLLNPGHAIECAWFLMHEGKLRNDPKLIESGRIILDWMWERGWDREYGGLLYFTDIAGLPVHEYWHNMKFWWPHNEAIIATLLAWKLTGKSFYAEMHRMVHNWSFAHFPDDQHGEWFGYLLRDGSVSSKAKGTLWKGPFHLPRMLWYCWKLLSDNHG